MACVCVCVYHFGHLWWACICFYFLIISTSTCPHGSFSQHTSSFQLQNLDFISPSTRAALLSQHWLSSKPSVQLRAVGAENIGSLAGFGWVTSRAQCSVCLQKRQANPDPLTANPTAICNTTASRAELSRAGQVPFGLMRRHWLELTALPWKHGSGNQGG